MLQAVQTTTEILDLAVFGSNEGFVVGEELHSAWRLRIAVVLTTFFFACVSTWEQRPANLSVSNVSAQFASSADSVQITQMFESPPRAFSSRWVSFEFR